MWALGRLVRLPRTEFTDLLAAQRELLRARRRLKREPPGALIKPVGDRSGSEKAPDRDRLRRIATSIERASSYGVFRPTCLVRAVSIERLLSDACGDSGAVVRVGVQTKDGELLAHAWIELDGEIIGDRSSVVRKFTPLQDFSGLQ